MSSQKNTGLTTQEVLESRSRYGTNVLTPPKRESVWKLLIEKFNDPIIKILIVAALLSLAIGFVEGEFTETIGIFCAIFLATGVSFWFEYDAKKRFEILNTVNDDILVKVIRDGNITEVARKDIVVGDVVLLSSGDEIPADGKLVEAITFTVNEAVLTGESETGKTTDEAAFNSDSTYPSNIVLRGTTVLEGNGMMTVEAVGDDTEYGKMSIQASTPSHEPTPLNKQLTRLSRIIGRIGAILAVFIFVILVLKGALVDKILVDGSTIQILNQLLKYFMVSVAVMVMAVPEGLPMSITLSLAINMKRMLKSNNLVRKMHASETMGAVTVICTDKTGTLTRNEMRVNTVDRYDEISDKLLQEQMAVNSTAHLDSTGKVIGNPTDGALLLWIKNQGADYAAMRGSVKYIDNITFSSERKFMATLVDSAVSVRRMIYIKGAPEVVRAMCRPGKDDAQLDASLKEYQGRAMRTLALAYAETEASKCQQAIDEGNLRFAAVIAISDPVREDVPDAVSQCLQAGIQIKIVTGDTSTTAREIARQIGLWDDNTDGDHSIITGIDFEAATDEELLSKLSDLKIMSRARPLDKQRLVHLLQQQGEVVAVTGDGTNDGPALKLAQVGLSMGSGTSVAKEASDITLLDDSFSSIVNAVMWGRSLYKNIQRFVMFQLTVNFSALTVVFLGSIFGSQMPLTVPQILWVNLIMDTFAAMALASLPPDLRVMTEKPRKNTDFIITPVMLRWIIGVGLVMIASLLFLLISWGTAITPVQLSIFFTAFVMMQFWNLLNAKAYGSPGKGTTRLWKNNELFVIVLAIILLGQIIIVSFGGEVFRTVPIKAVEWGYIIAGTSLISIGGWLVRRLRG